jgi:hypothetical protein
MWQAILRCGERVDTNTVVVPMDDLTPLLLGRFHSAVVHNIDDDQLRVHGRFIFEEDPQQVALGWGDYGETQQGTGLWLYTCLLGRQAAWELRNGAQAEAVMQSITQKVADRSVNGRNAIDTVEAIIANHDRVRYHLTWQLHQMGLPPEDEVIVVRPQELLDDPELAIGDSRLRLVETRRHRYVLGRVRGSSREVTRFPLDPAP